MVKVVVNDLQQITLLDYELERNGIEHTIVADDGKYGITPPYLLVNNVPLDEMRAFKWIKEQNR